MDFYGGWKKTWGDWGLDLGGIYYYYPGTDATRNGVDSNREHRPTGRINNQELYIGGSWKWLSLKYSHAVSDYFFAAANEGLES